ncbi:MAG: ankyrin repeat domain-containing protein [Candidatus Eremiobacteraeota bacterium]|nr:ankyrin repeat domain-containing protein [Candidatus Eremiobacteraeota bacterium]
MKSFIIPIAFILLLGILAGSVLAQNLDYDKWMWQRWEKNQTGGGNNAAQGKTTSAKSTYVEPPFVTALKQANLEEVRKLLNQNPAYINFKDDLSRTPLHYAAMKGNASLIEFLLVRGAHNGEKDSYGLTPLNIAKQYNNKEAEKALSGASQKAAYQRSEGDELCLAASRGEADKVKAFLEKNKGLASFKEQYSGWTPLHWALTKPQDSIEIVEFLVSSGADINAKDNNNITPFSLAVAHSKKKCADYLLSKGADINSADKFGTTALHGALILGNDAMESYLLEHNARVNVKGEKGNTPLHLAAWNGKIRLMKPLVEKGADITARDDSGYTALMISAQEGFLELVKYLVSRGGAVNDRKNDGATALMVASAKDRDDVVLFLIEKGAAINAQADDGWTPLRSAVEYAQARIVKLLISRGADVNLPDKEGITPLKRAMKKNAASIADILKSSGAHE